MRKRNKKKRNKMRSIQNKNKETTNSNLRHPARHLNVGFRESSSRTNNWGQEQWNGNQEKKANIDTRIGTFVPTVHN